MLRGDRQISEKNDKEMVALGELLSTQMFELFLK
jgi:hypothetical protein